MGSLGRALRLSDLTATDPLWDCSLNGCIAHSEKNDSNLVEWFGVVSSNSKKNNKTNRKWRTRNVDADTPALYRTPIRIPKRSIREGHNMGRTLFLIVTFNLALAHHLKALKKTESFSS